MGFIDEKLQTCNYIGIGSVPCERPSYMAVQYNDRKEIEYPCAKHYAAIPKELIAWEEKLERT